MNRRESIAAAFTGLAAVLWPWGAKPTYPIVTKMAGFTVTTNVVASGQLRDVRWIVHGEKNGPLLLDVEDINGRWRTEGAAYVCKHCGSPLGHCEHDPLFTIKEN